MPTRTRTRSSAAEERTLTSLYFNNWYKVVDGNCTLTNQITDTLSYVKCDYISTETMTDVVTPKFHSRIAKGEIINNPLSQNKSTVVENDCTFTWYNAYPGTAPCDIRYEGGGSTLQPSSLHINIQDTVNYHSSVVNNISDFVSDVSLTNAWASADASSMSLLATLGEFPETIESLVSIFKRVIKITKALKRLDKRVLLNELSPKQLSDRYMEARYALRPLMYDITDIIASVNTLLKSESFKRHTFRGRKSSTNTYLHSVPVAKDSNWGYTLHMDCVVDVSAYSGVLASLDLSNPIGILGIDQIFEAIWELTPFSFIVDWFFNVGNTIASWTPNVGVDCLSSFTTLKTTVIYSSFIDECWSTPGTKYHSIDREISNAKIIRTDVLKTRVPNPIREIVPNFNIKLDALKLLDLGIIIKGILFK